MQKPQKSSSSSAPSTAHLAAGGSGAGGADLRALLLEVVETGASDLHLKVGRPPIVRRDGLLSPLEGWGRLDSDRLEEFVKELGASDPKRLAAFWETGELDTSHESAGLPRLRVNAFFQRGEVSCALRVIPSAVPTFDELGLPPGIRRLADLHHGLILVTGATGVGKTTTLASMIGHINRTRSQHIVTIEDPIEIVHTDESSIINQREVGLDTASFGEALRRALRQDPDVILIGELRDSETAETALQAAESGHLVLSTMHTIDAAETIRRLVEFFPAVKQAQVRSVLAGVLRGVVSQSLLPKIGGGRVAAVEVMIANSRIEELLRENRAEEIPAAIADGQFFEMQTLSHALIDLVLSGDVEPEVAAAAAPNRHDFQLALERAGKARLAATGAAPHSRPAPGNGSPDPRPHSLRVLVPAADGHGSEA
jgi:twitching motility protein PilT